MAKLTQSDKDNIARLFNEGMTREDIQVKTGFGRATVYRYTPRTISSQSELASLRKVLIRKHYDAGNDTSQIAEITGFHKSTITRALVGYRKAMIKAKKAPSPIKDKKINPPKTMKPKIKDKSHTSEIKELWLSGKNMSYIKQKLKISFNTVKQTIIDLGLEDHNLPKLEIKDRPALYKRLWIPERRLWIETYSEEEYDLKSEKYATK